MNYAAYLSRIGVANDNLLPNEQTLRLLQRQHLLTVPFENLDIHWKRPITLDLERFYEKIVKCRRGGFCYELNGLFNELLKHIGFETRLVSARVFNGSKFGPEFDHIAIMATFGEGEHEKIYLVDVGFGAFAAEPLLFRLGVELLDATGSFLFSHRRDGYFEVIKREADIWKSEYKFSGNERNLAEFAEMCDFQQYSPDSHFTKGKLCSLMTSTGRKTLTDKSFIETSNGERLETAVDSEQDFAEILDREFGIVTPETATPVRNN